VYRGQACVCPAIRPPHQTHPQSHPGRCETDRTTHSLALTASVLLVKSETPARDEPRSSRRRLTSRLLRAVDASVRRPTDLALAPRPKQASRAPSGDARPWSEGRAAAHHGRSSKTAASNRRGAARLARALDRASRRLVASSWRQAVAAPATRRREGDGRGVSRTLPSLPRHDDRAPRPHERRLLSSRPWGSRPGRRGSAQRSGTCAMADRSGRPRCRSRWGPGARRSTRP
jgi:hypothetical protein